MKLSISVLSILTGLAFLSSSCQSTSEQHSSPSYFQQVSALLGDTIIQMADQQLSSPVVTVTAHECARSTGGKHDFYSEGDYWWPHPTEPDSPFVRRDGMSYPDAFFEHRKSLMSLSELVGNLTSAYLLSGKKSYAEKALEHCHAWFIADSTKMNPHFLYAQAIKGRHTGRGIGIIDGIHFMDVFQSIRVLDQKGMVSAADMDAYQSWVGQFLDWHMNHPYGKAEMVHPNNHSMYFNLQVGLYASFTENDSVLNYCRTNFTETLLPKQMAADGSFPLELARTKPYEYSLFNLDGTAINCLILSDEQHDVWNFQTLEGKTANKALAYMKPFVDEKDSWPLPPDVMYWEAWPIAHPAFLFGAMALDRQAYYQTWATKPHFSDIFEVRRTKTIKSPLIWMRE
ncbi:MAG: alginate lyase family protein [Bacteroidota bacterium]